MERGKEGKKEGKDQRIQGSKDPREIRPSDPCLSGRQAQILRSSHPLPLFLFLSFFPSFLLLTNCSGPHSPEKYREARELMSTVFQLDVCADQYPQEQIDRAYARVWERMEDIAWRMNVFDERSDVAKINNALDEPVEVGADTYELLKKSFEMNRLTKGAFDITVWPLIKLWKEAEGNGMPPAENEIEAARAVLGENNFEFLGNNRVHRLNTKTKIDLGGIAQGYAVDEAARIFREEGIENFFIDGSGDIYVGGRNCQGEKWRVGIRDPRDSSRLVDVIAASNQSVTTSGNYERYFKIGDKKFSHIIDPRTGYPQEGPDSTTVIAPTATDTDALSTALMVLGEMEGIKIIESLGPEYAAIIVVLDESEKVMVYSSQNYQTVKAQK